MHQFMYCIYPKYWEAWSPKLHILKFEQIHVTTYWVCIMLVQNVKACEFWSDCSKKQSDLAQACNQIFRVDTLYQDIEKQDLDEMILPIISFIQYTTCMLFGRCAY